MTPLLIGGSFAPPITDEVLDRYSELSDYAPGPVADAMSALIKMCRKFIETPRSRLRGRPHPSGAAIDVVSLEEPEKARMWEEIPWTVEIDMYSELFSKLPPGAREGPAQERQTPDGRAYLTPTRIVTNESQEQLRNACFHLLWYARELDLDREPLTADQLR